MLFNTEQFLDVLTDVWNLIKAHESMRGAITYEATEEKGVWEVVGCYGTSQDQGQGGIRVLDSADGVKFPPDTAEHIHAGLRRIYNEMRAIGLLPGLNTLSPSTTYAMGEALGALNNACAQIGRDVDDRHRRESRTKDNSAYSQGGA